MFDENFKVSRAKIFDEQVFTTNFLLTLNTNKFPQTEEDLDFWEKTTTSMIESEFNQRNVIESITKQLNGTKYIYSSDMKYNTEIGQKKYGKRYHCHIYLKITHTGEIMIDLINLREIVERYWILIGVTNPYINAKIITSESGIMEYLNKNGNEL